MNQLIIVAIESRQLLELIYHDKLRIVEPHCYGMDNGGAEKMRCYQVGLIGAAYDRGSWKMLNVAEIRNLKATGRHFTGPRPEYNPNDPGIARFFARL